MRHQNGEGPDHRGDGVEARGLEQLGRRLEVLATTETSTGQDRAVRAEIIGSDQCAVEGLSARGASPVLALCRSLIRAGFNSARPLCAYRGDVLALSVRSIGEASRLRISSHGVGFERLPECTGGAPVRQNAPTVVGPWAGDGGTL